MAAASTTARTICSTNWSGRTTSPSALAVAAQSARIIRYGTRSATSEPRLATWPESLRVTIARIQKVDSDDCKEPRLCGTRSSIGRHCAKRLQSCGTTQKVCDSTSATRFPSVATRQRGGGCLKIRLPSILSGKVRAQQQQQHRFAHAHRASLSFSPFSSHLSFPSFQNVAKSRNFSSRKSVHPVVRMSHAVEADPDLRVTKMGTCVEHLVLLKVKADASPEAVADMVYALRGLGNLDPPLGGVIEVACGELIAKPLTDLPGGFTHGLHVRCKDKNALTSYASSPQHVDVVTRFVKPIIEDILALDWEAALLTGPLDDGVHVLRAGAIKLKDGVTPDEIHKMVQSIMDWEGLIPGLRQLTIGENFAPERAKGYNWGFIARFGNLQDLMKFVRDDDHCVVMDDVVRPIASSVTIVDFMIGPDHFSRM